MQPARTFGTRELGEPWSLDNNERDWRAIARVLCSGPGLFAGAATSHGDWAQNLGTGERAPANLVQIAIASASSASQPSSAIA